MPSPLFVIRMRLAQFNTGTKILGSFCLVSLVIIVITGVALWRLHAADRITSGLVNDKLAKQQLTSEMLGVARLNGLRTLAIARSDSLELGDLYMAQLRDGEKEATRIETAVRSLPASGDEGSLLQAASGHKAALASAAKAVFAAKDLGRTQEVDELLAAQLEPALARYTGSLGALLAFQAQQAHALARESTGASGFSRVLLVMFGAVALVTGGLLGWVLTRNIVGPLQQAVSLAEQVARGDLRPVIAHGRRDEIGRLFDALNSMTSEVSHTVAQVLCGAREIDSASAGIADGNHALTQRSERQAVALKQTTSAMGALTDAIARNNVNAHRANELAQGASNVAAEGARAVEQVVSRMNRLKASADKIVSITSLIDSIAFQTNILALNAAVEAARAGSEGRGFAVVAAEVRNLAQHSAAAAKEIKELIKASSGEIEAGTSSADAAGATMGAVLRHVQEVAQLLAAIHAGSTGQASGVAEVGRAIADIDLATRQNAAMVEQAVDAAEAMRLQAAGLAQLVGTFKVKDAPALPAPQYA
ncbi:MAG: methyl-accepting chemotaxis protein [Telluria sp.]